MEPHAESSPHGVSGAMFQPLGRHRVAVTDDLIWLVAVGGLDLPETVQLTDLCYQVADRYGYTLVLVDAQNGAPASPESRRYQLGRLKQRIAPSHSAIYGANLVVTTFISLYHRGVEILLKKVPPVSYHKDEAAARARLAAEREHLRRQAASSSSSTSQR